MPYTASKEFSQYCELTQILHQRHGISLEDADNWVTEARNKVASGREPKEVLFSEFGIEEDFGLDLL